MFTENPSTENLKNWNTYIETLPCGGATMKLDRILKRRMRAFLKLRKTVIND